MSDEDKAVCYFFGTIALLLTVVAVGFTWFQFHAEHHRHTEAMYQLEHGQAPKAEAGK